jgi:MFS family permease
MEGAILALVAPLLMKEFAIDLATYRSGVQIALFISIVGLYLWPWLADRFGQRNILALNIAVFSLAMPLVALSPGWGATVAVVWTASGPRSMTPETADCLAKAKQYFAGAKQIAALPLP